MIRKYFLRQIINVYTFLPHNILPVLSWLVRVKYVPMHCLTAYKNVDCNFISYNFYKIKYLSMKSRDCVVKSPAQISEPLITSSCFKVYIVSVKHLTGCFGLYNSFSNINMNYFVMLRRRTIGSVVRMLVCAIILGSNHIISDHFLICIGWSWLKSTTFIKSQLVCLTYQN